MLRARHGRDAGTVPRMKVAGGRTVLDERLGPPPGGG